MSSPASTPRVVRAPFGRLPDGSEVDVFTLTNPAGLELRASSFGGAILSLQAPDRAGHLADVVLGYDRLEDYVADRFYMGTLMGRYSNRIGGALFALDGRTFRLPVNDGPHHLHGGPGGFHKRLWQAEAFTDASAAGLVLRRVSAGGEEGYPGELRVEVVYRWASPATLEISYAATTDAPTPVSLTHHGYYNLAGQGDVLGHLLQIEADHFLPADRTSIPIGGLASVTQTPFDFREPRALGAAIEADTPQLRQGGGYDINFVLRRTGPGLVRAARVVEPVSGRRLTVHTTEPGLQLYSGNHLDGRVRGKAGRALGRRHGLCLEPQQFPDAPNHPEFPSPILRPGQEYRSRTQLVFDASGGA